MSFGMGETEYDDNYDAERRKKIAEANRIKKEIAKKSKKELVQIAYDLEILKQPHNSIPVNVKEVEVFYSLVEDCFFARIEIESCIKYQAIYLIECNKAYDLPVHY